MEEIIWKGEGIAKTYGNVGFTLQDISFSVNSGEITGVVGENGNGKTTLLRIMAGELDTNKGSIEAFGNIIYPENWRTFKEKISYIPQRIPRWYGHLRTNLEFQASSHGIAPDKVKGKIDQLLTELGLKDYAHLRWTEISTGYRLRFQLAKMLIGNPSLIILDEPIANLDINAQEKFLSDLRRIVSNEDFKTAVILSSQQLHQVESFSDNIIFIKQGKIQYSGKVDEVGADRKMNSFEISGSFTETDLSSLLGGNGKIISKKGKSFQIETSLEFDHKKLLISVLEQNYAINYFRDISSSTKKMFK